MRDEPDTLQELAGILREVGASARVRPERIVRSTLYDLDYHVALIACVFFLAAEKEDGRQRIIAHWLKILQFVAVRPTLVSDFEAWAQTRRNQDLRIWQKMPRGYLGDSTHERTVELLVAVHILAREDDTLVPGTRFTKLQRIFATLVTNDLLRSEREILAELSTIRVNKTLLKGI